MELKNLKVTEMSRGEKQEAKGGKSYIIVPTGPVVPFVSLLLKYLQNK